MSGPSELELICRVAQPQDALAIRQILRESQLSPPAFGDVGRASQAGIGETLTFVCVEHLEITGFLQWRNLGSEAEILDLAVRLDHRRRGHASSLLRHFLQFVAGVTGIFLEVRESNAAAIALYEKFGFHVTGRRPNYYRHPEEAALLMSLRFPA